MQSDFFNEAIISAMLVAAPHHEIEETETAEQDLMQADILKDHLITLLDKSKRLAVQAGLPEDLVEVADFAVCAFIDEILLSSQTWTDRISWQKKTLQLIRHNTATAGEDFYQILNTLLDEAKKKDKLKNTTSSIKQDITFWDVDNNPKKNSLHTVLEIFALCLSQGFTGMYYDNPRAIQRELNRISEIIPAIKNRNQFFVFSPTEPEQKQGFKQKIKKILHRFDILDWALWIGPILISIILYQIYSAKLHALLQPFLSDGGLS